MPTLPAMRVYDCFEVEDDKGVPAGHPIAARDLRTNQPLMLYKWQPGPGELEKVQDKAKHICDEGGLEVFSDGVFLWLAAANEMAATPVLQQLRRNALFVETVVVPTPSLPPPLPPPIPKSAPPPAPIKPEPPTPPVPAPKRGRRFPWFGMFVLLGACVGLFYFLRSVYRPQRPAPPDLMVSMDGRVTAGNGRNLHWSSPNADSVSIDQGIGEEPRSGSVLVHPNADTTYTVVARNAGGSSSQRITVHVRAGRMSKPTPSGAASTLAATSDTPSTAASSSSTAASTPSIAPSTLSTTPSSTTRAAPVPATSAPMAKPTPSTAAPTSATPAATTSTTAAREQPAPKNKETSGVAAPEVTFSSSPAVLLQPCQAVTLSWQISGNYTGAHISPPFFFRGAAANSVVVHPARTTRYTLNVGWAGGSPVAREQLVLVVPSAATAQAPPHCGEVTWEGVLPASGQVMIDWTRGMAESAPPGAISGGVPHYSSVFYPIESGVSVLRQPATTQTASVVIHASVKGRALIHLYWQDR